MIDKTEGDILKVEHEITKEKGIMERKYKEQCLQIESNFQSKCSLHAHETEQHLAKLQAETKTLQKVIEEKKGQYTKEQGMTVAEYERKTTYEENQNRIVQ